MDRSGQWHDRAPHEGVGASATDVFAVGYDGTILHYDGVSWTSQASGTQKDLQGVWGSSGRDVYAAGYDGALVHYDGHVWSPVRWWTAREMQP
jgi:hypothetical protein